MDERPKRLACQSCQRRKIKCDRDLPCRMCLKNGAQCIPVLSQRLPRGRTGGRRKTDEVLAARIEKLEGLLVSLQNQGQLPDTSTQYNSAGQVESDVAQQPQPDVPSKYQYLGTAFWTSLKDELNDIQHSLDTQHEPVDDLAEDASTPDNAAESPPGLVDIATGTFVSSVLLQPPPPVLRRQLCRIFLTNVDPVFKVLHAPTVRAHIEEGAPYLDYEAGDHAVTALKFVVYYAAVVTMSNHQCEIDIGQPKLQLLQQYRTMAEAALSQAEYIISTDLVTLQAFVLYLAMLRHEDRTRRCWTLVSLAVRIGFAIGLHNEKQCFNSFATEQRRRLWHQICVLDLQVAVDLASDPLILPGTHDTLPPSNINDVDLVYGSATPVTPRPGWTDMTFSLMTQLIAAGAVRAHLAQSGTWQQRQEIILALGEKLESRFFVFCDTANTLQAFTIAVGKGNVAACLLHAIRPTAASTGVTVPPINSEYVLSLAVNALSFSQQCTSNPLMAGWNWILWVQWHALAVAFASLGFLARGTLVERAWIVAESSLSEFVSATANGQQAQLQKPLEKLAAKARRAKAAASSRAIFSPLLTDAEERFGSEGARDMSTQPEEPDPNPLLNVSPTGPLDAVDPLQSLIHDQEMEGWDIWQEFLESFTDPMNISI